MNIPIVLWKYVLSYGDINSLFGLSLTNKEFNKEILNHKFLKYYIKNKYTFLNDIIGDYLINTYYKSNLILLLLNDCEKKYYKLTEGLFFEKQIKKNVLKNLESRIKYSTEIEKKKHPIIKFEFNNLKKIKKRIVIINKTLHIHYNDFIKNCKIQIFTILLN